MTNAEHYLLKTKDGKLSLVPNDAALPGPIYVEFAQGKLAYRRKHPGKEALKQALGLKAHPHPYVVDATAGLGQDACMLAHFGCRVLMIEQSAILAQLLEDGLTRARLHFPDLMARLSYVCGDARVLLKNLEEQPDIVYLDPMFPERKKSAQVKKEMWVLQHILKPESSDDLLAIALAVAKHRVIVKRPYYADCLNKQKPNFQLKGRTNRFDVYLSGERGQRE